MMGQNYEEVVREWYNRLRPEFLRRLTAKYSGLTLFDAEDIYQNTFIAVHENLLRGRVKEDTSWSSYIMTIGMNLASKTWQKIGKTDSTDQAQNGDGDDGDSKPKLSRIVEDILKTTQSGDEDVPLCRNENALAILGDELSHTPEPCRSIITLFYYENMSMAEIAEEFGYSNEKSAKTKKSRCMTDLIARVTASLRRAGFDVSPKNRNRNGRS